MKRFIMAIVCLMTMVLSANAQRRYYTRSYGVRPHSTSYYYNRYSNISNGRKSYSSYYQKDNTTTYKPTNDDMYYKSPRKHKENDDSWMENFVLFGIGVGGSNINLKEHSNGTFDIDLIAMNVLFSAKISDLFTIDPNKMDLNNASSIQLGILFPIYTFDKSEYAFGKKGKIFVAPLIEFVSADDVNIDGHYLHENVPYHNCQYWISTTTTKDLSSTGYGGAVMIKYGCGYLLGKVTNKSVGISVGLAI